MKVMVCGPIGYGDLSKIRKLQSLLREKGFTVLDHISEKAMDYSGIKDFRDKRELAKKIVQHDLNFIKNSDVVVALSNGPSYGTAIEMYVAKKLEKKVIFLSENVVPTPWPVALSDHIVSNEKELFSVLEEMTL